MIHISVKQRDDFNSDLEEVTTLELNSFSIKDYIMEQNTFCYVGYEGNYDVYTMDNNYLFKTLQDLKELEKEEDKYEVTFDDLYNIYYIEDVYTLKKFLFDITLEPNFDWRNYVIVAEIEFFNELILDV